FDPSEKAGLDLLDDMSYLEMKARTEASRRRRDETAPKKREQIAAVRAARIKDLQQRKEGISAVRAAAAAA
ncbi:unnamed protein product, partial [Phaeothamnion confervicola]